MDCKTIETNLRSVLQWIVGLGGLGLFFVCVGYFISSGTDTVWGFVGMLICFVVVAGAMLILAIVFISWLVEEIDFCND